MFGKEDKKCQAVEISTKTNKAGVHVLGYNFDINNKKNEKILLENFKHIPSKGKFIETVMNENCPAYVKKESIIINYNFIKEISFVNIK